VFPEATSKDNSAVTVGASSTYVVDFLHLPVDAVATKKLMTIITQNDLNSIAEYVDRTFRLN
jgi:hypothetical protein